MIAYHANMLLELGCIELVSTRHDRALSTPPARAPSSATRTGGGHRSVRGGVTSEAIRALVAKIDAVIDADTIDSGEDTTLNWMPITVDERGWRESAEILDRAQQDL